MVNRMRETIYLTHPVSAEKRKECNDKGLKVVDAKFKPFEAEAEKPKKKRKSKSAK